MPGLSITAHVSDELLTEIDAGSSEVLLTAVSKGDVVKKKSDGRHQVSLLKSHIWISVLLTELEFI